MYRKLESLRGIAAVLVILYHSPFNYINEPFAFFNNSYLFVDFFFVLSGFVMSFAYYDKIRTHLSFKKYILLRLGRLYPLHIFVLLLWVPYVLIKQYLYSIGAGGTDQFDTSNIYTFISNIFLVHSLGIHSSLGWNIPSWSISTEFFAYILFFLTTSFLDKRNQLYFPLAVSMFSYIFVFNLDYPNLDITYDYGFIRCVGGFYLGIFVFRLKQKNFLNRLIAENISILEYAMILILIIIVSYSSIYRFSLYLVPIIFAIAIYIFSESKNGTIGNFLETKILKEIGTRSYSIYMINNLVIFILSNIFVHIIHIDPINPVGFYSLLINLFLIVFVIWISKYTYIFVEKKFRDLTKEKLKTIK